MVVSGNPKGIQTMADLAKPGLSVVLAGPGAPPGDYAAKAPNAAAPIGLLPRLRRRLSRSPRGAVAAIGVSGAAARG